MTQNYDTTSKRRLSAKLATGLALSALLAFGAFAAPASAADRGGDHRGGGGDHRGGGGFGWGGGGYYPAPPVVYYGAPYYAPPLIYAPGVSIGVW
jgi:hypothetical protein